MVSRLQLYPIFLVAFLVVRIALSYLWASAPDQPGWVRDANHLREAEARAQAASQGKGGLPSDDLPLGDLMPAASSDPASSDSDHDHRDSWGNPYRCTMAKEGETTRLGVYSTGEDGISRSHGNDPDDLNSWSYNGRAHYREQDRLRDLRSRVSAFALWFLYALGFAAVVTETFLFIANANRGKTGGLRA